MRNTWFLMFCVAYLILLGLDGGFARKALSDINVNLPLTCEDCRKAQHTIQAFEGCYKW